MKIKLAILFAAGFFSAAYTQVCSNVPNCNSGNNFQTACVVYVNTDSVTDITSNSAVLRGWGSTSDAGYFYGSYPLCFTAIAAWSTNCQPVCFSNLSALDTAVIVYNNTTSSAWVNNVYTKIQMKNLQPNTTYYVRYMICQTFYPDNIPPYATYTNPFYNIGNILQFTTLPAPVPISNNSITSGNQSVCASQSSYYQAATITASTPTGGNGVYQYIWQKKTGSNTTWQNCSGADSVNHTPAAISGALTSTQVYYRRIVSSGQVSDTSNTISVTYFSQLGVPKDASAPYGFIAAANPTHIKDVSVKVTGSFQLCNAVNAFNTKYGSGAGSGLGTNFTVVPQAYLTFINPAGRKLHYTNATVTTSTISTTAATYASTGSLITYTMTISGLLPSTSYTVEQFVQVTVNNSCALPAKQGNTINFYAQKGAYGQPFTTKADLPPDIQNNYITTSPQVICPGGYPVQFYPPAINATSPTGGTGTYTYLWIKSGDGGNTWVPGETINGTNTSASYTPSNFASFSSSSALYKRIVYSGPLTDTSSAVAYTFAYSSPSLQFSVSQTPIAAGKLLLKPLITNPAGAYTVQWKDSIKDGFLGNIPSLSDGSLLVTDSAINKYHYRLTVSYGNNCPVYTSRPISVSAKDGDGNMYPAVSIGAQTWFMSNLRTTTYTNGQAIPLLEPWTSVSTPAYTWYNYDSIGNAVDYGALYNRPLAMSQNVCPVGWHVATTTDWFTLINYLGVSDAGALLKARDKWLAPNKAQNAYNFNGLPAGEVMPDGSFNGKLNSAYWWGVYGKAIYAYKMVSIDGRVYVINADANSNLQNSGFSIRCVKNY